MKKFLVGFILFSMVVSVIPGAVVDDCDTTCVWCMDWEPYGLYAGQNELVGNVSVRVCGDNLEYKYEITEPGWCISEIHLMALNESPNDTSSSWYTKYVTKKGNPKVGKFEVNKEGLCVTEYSGTLDISEFYDGPCDKLYIAAHAVVCRCDVEKKCVEADEDNSWAVGFENYIAGNGTGNDENRYDPYRCLGVANVLSGDRENFTSLGRDGSIELFFENKICGDGDCTTPDLEVYEITYNQNTDWEELISVEAYYGGNYHYIGSALNANGSTAVNDSFINYFTLPCECIEKIRITDMSTGASSSGQVFDYDIDGVKANYWCISEYTCTDECETAWGKGTSFPGNNWAMYFEYGGCICN
ncbi:hypothetical protein [Methanococcus maripaludis]|uniref:Uncharacterized protein n=1 Tax=Methanococcus maripaludis TaxID=39152 RepID=A0A8T4CIJ1_METMI|nr:hypothetical protein [Methanococcus maripaludis]MBM7408480.1 hypothetical protein [Methanococcus maripaludis]MBP2220212.1 hypothetical protein [Methanococcus maripaludis]